MAFKFVNPGYPALFDTMDSGSLIGGVNSTYNPENGVYIDTCSAPGHVTIPNLAHIYISFGLYPLNSTGSKPFFDLYKDNTNIGQLRTSSQGTGLELFGAPDNVLATISLANNKYYKCLLDFELDGSIEKISFYIDGEKKAEVTCDCSIKIFTKVRVCRSSSDCNYAMISNIIISDIDYSDEKIAICDLVPNNDVITVDADALMTEMAKYVDNAAITSLQVGASSIEVASSDISSIKETLNSTDIETKSINAQKGVIFNNMAVNPLTGGNWTIQALKDIRFKLTGVKA